MRRAAEAPRAIVGSVAVAAVHHAAVLAFARRIVRHQRARVLRRRRHPLLGVPTMHRHLLLWGVGTAVFAVLAVLLLKGSRVAWWVRVVGICLGLLPLLRPPHDPVLLALFVPLAVELGLLLTPSARAYVRQPPR